MKRRFTLFLPLLMLSLSVFCQDKPTDKKQRDKDAPMDKYKRTNYELEPLKNKTPLSFPVSTIVVLDVRQDTTKFGYSIPGTLLSSFKQLCFDNGAATDIAFFLNQSFIPGSPQSAQKLLYCLKKCWLTHTDTTDEYNHKFNTNSSKFYLKAELYLEKDSTCYPLYRFDSVFTYKKNPGSSSDNWIKKALLASLQNLNSVNPEKVVKRTSLKRAGINGYYADENHTVINTVTTPAKGVYLNIDQFKNNRPYYTSYEISYEKTVDIMRVKEHDGNFSVIKTDWGYCDGEHFFMRIGQNYFRLFKCGYTYELNGSDLMDIGDPGSSNYTTDGYWAPLLSGDRRISKGMGLGRLKPLQLDMETGKVY